MEPVGCAVIGLGPMGCEHAEVLRQSSAANLLVCCDLDPEAEQRCPAGSDFTTDISDALQRRGVEAVFVCTSEAAHRDPVIAALDAGLSVFCEKPFATSVEDCDAMIATSTRTGSLLAVGHILRFDPRYLTIAEALRDGRLGRPVHLLARRICDAAQGRWVACGTTLPMYLGVHDLDIFRWYVGEIDRVYAEAAHVGVTGAEIADSVLGTVRFRSGAVGVLELSWATPVGSGIERDIQLELIGSAGSAYLNSQAGVSLYRSGGADVYQSSGWPRIYGMPSGILRSEVEYFLMVVRGSAVWPQEPADARAAVAAAVALDLSAVLGRPVSLTEVMPALAIEQCRRERSYLARDSKAPEQT